MASEDNQRQLANSFARNEKSTEGFQPDQPETRPPEQAVQSLFLQEERRLIVEGAQNARVYAKSQSNYILISESDLRLYFDKHLKDVEQKRAWIAPAGIFITLLTVLAVSDFKDFLGITAPTWKAIFTVTGIIVFIWLIQGLIQRFRSLTTDNLIEEIIKDSTAH